MQNEDMTPAEWHNHEEYGADVDLFGYPDEERASGYSTFWRKKNEKVFIEDYDTHLVELPVLKEIRSEWRTNEYTYFRCERTKRSVMLTSLDFDYCPFCGKKLAEKE